MARFWLVLFSVFLLAACDPARVPTLTASSSGGAVCDSRSAGRCQFVNGPVQLQPQPVKLARRSATFYPMQSRLGFIDGTTAKWEAPVGTLTDGASIPPLFHGIVGDPTSPEFADAAAMHDAYCGIGNESGPNYHARAWPQVHRMFYDALRVGGTPERKAKLMFAAVWLGGPRWGDWDRGLTDVPGSEKKQILKRAQTLIEGQNPSVDALVDFLTQQEALAIANTRETVQGGGVMDGYGGETDPSTGI